MRVITQNISQRAADPNGFTVSDTDVTGPFPLNLPIDGVLSSILPWNGDSVVDLSDGIGVLVGFTTGATGSVADVTIVGRNQFGDPLTEVVTMPGAASAVSSTEVFSYIESMSIDAAYTNLEVGVIAADAQYSPWTPWDTYAGDFEATISADVISGTINYTLEHTIQDRFFQDGPEPDNFFDDTNMAGETADDVVVVSQPITASRIRINSGSAAVLKIKYLQQGGGFR